MSRLTRAAGAAAVGLIFLVLVGGLTSCDAPPQEIVAGSTLIQGIVHDIAGHGCPAHNLIPAGMCPGHFDMRPSDVEIIARSRALIIHEWQRQMGSMKGVIGAAGLPDERVKVVDVEGNWMVPSVQAEAVQAIARILGEVDPAGADAYAQKAAERSEFIRSYGERAKGRMREGGVEGLQALCSEMQAGFVNWAGLEIVADYGRPEDMSVAEVERLIGQAREAKVALVVDNLQSGDTQISETLARETGAVHVVLSNFPGGFEDTATWEKALDKNVELLLDAVDRWRQDHG